MYSRVLLPAFLLFATLVSARDKAETWYEIRSPHFVVVSNSSDRQGRHTAGQFERMRSVFQRRFPRDDIDPAAPIVVLAIQDQKDFRALEPSAYLAKGSLQLGGLFLPAADKNYVLMRLDAEGEHPYAVVYHEYTHLLVSKIDRLPLWLNEGIAEFYQNTEIHGKDVALGEPDPLNLRLLRQYALLPLPTLFRVDQSSPYYHEETRGSIFYGESWALTHYLLFKDFKEKTQHIGDYLQLVAQGMDPVTAAAHAFGDLKQLQSALEAYVRQPTFSYIKSPGTTDIDESTFQSRELTETQADAFRADFLAYIQRTADAKALIDQILQQDPNNVAARETLGFLAFKEHNLAEARRWYAEAVKLDSQSYLAHYYFAAIGMSLPMDAAEVPEMENSLRACTKLNSKFAPCYDRLAVVLMQQRKDLDDAHLMALTAVQLEPENLGYRIDTANVFMHMNRPEDAVRVIQAAMHLAKTPQEKEMAEMLLSNASQYSQAQSEGPTLLRDGPDGEVTTSSNEEKAVADPAPDQPVPTGPHHSLTGLLTDVTCHGAALDLELSVGGKRFPMHANNYFKVQYSTLGVDLEGNLKPCSDLDGKRARVEYIDSGTQGGPAALVAIEIHK
jgi:tetratricopeptide (TPR) repeat protein